jgi:hypothetical protein
METMTRLAQLRGYYAEDARNSGQSPLGAVASLIASDHLSRDTFNDVLGRHGLASPDSILGGLLDQIIGAVRVALADHRLSPDKQLFFREIKTYCRIPAGSFYEHRAREVSDLLCEQVARMISDGRVSGEEALQQVELQTLFDLSYDQYLELTRRPIAALIDQLIATFVADGVLTQHERAALERQLIALDTVFVLDAPQRAALARAQLQ